MRLPKFRFVPLFVILLTLGVQGYGDHLLGGELTYEHIKDDEYKVFVHVYRDCNGCKIDGQGGGSSTINCGKIPLFLRTSTKNGCSSTQLDRFELTRTSIKSVLPVCSSASDACAPSGTMSLGIEEHVFEVVVDLADYRSYFQCGFEFFIQASSRIEDATNLSNTSGVEPPLYNYCYLNPGLKTSSPKYSSAPRFVTQCNVPVNGSVISSSNSDDSLVTKVKNPLKGFQDEIPFSTGYSADQPLKVYCTDGDCNASPFASPSEGFYLNPTSGYVVYTPVKCNEAANLVFETEHWIRTSQGYQLNSIVRRDFVQQVLSLKNVNPILKGLQSDQLYACAGVSSKWVFTAMDTAFLRPDGTRLKQDTVRFTYSTNLPDASFAVLPSDTAPFFKLEMTVFTELAQEEPYWVRIGLVDDFCPINGTSEYTFQLHVSENPEKAVVSSSLWCRRIELKSTSADYEVTWVMNNSDSFVFEGVEKDTVYLNYHDDSVRLSAYVDGKGCSLSLDSLYTFTLDELKGVSLEFGEVGTKCLGSTLEVEHINVDSFDAAAVWYTNVDTSTRRAEVYLSRLQTSVRALTRLTRNGYVCRDTHDVVLEANPGPEVTWNEPTICPGVGLVDLYDFVSPKTGKFEDSLRMLESLRYFKSDSVYDPRVPASHCFVYSVVGSDGCPSKDTFCVNTQSSPEARVRDMSICYSDFTYNLDRTILEPYDYFTTSRKWFKDGIELPMVDNAFDYDMSNLVLGDNEFVFEINYSSGCSRTDTLTINLANDPRIEFDVPDRICQNEDLDLVVLLKKDLGFGFWTSSSHPGDVFLNRLSGEVCGKVELTYTYDNFGCFLTKDTIIEVQCKPNVDLNLPDTACQGSELELTKVKPSDVWQIGGIYYPDIDAFTLPQNSDTALEFIYTLGGEGCDFNFKHTMALTGAPEFVLSEPWDSVVCMGDTIDLEILEVKNGELKDENGENLALPLRIFEVPNASGKKTLTFYKRGIGYCPDTADDFVLQVRPQVRVRSLDYDLEYCEPALIIPTYVWETNGSSNFTHRWILKNSIGETIAVDDEEIIAFDGLGKDGYTLHVETSSEEGCLWDTSGHQAVVFESPNADFVMNPNGNLSTKERTMEFYNRSEGLDSLTFEWDFGFDRTATYGKDQRIEFPYDTGTYNVTMVATNTYGCTDTVIKQVFVGADFLIYVPNAFSPNGEGPIENNEFKVYADFVKSYELVIRSRWGDIVYLTNDVNDTWDGTFKGKICPAGMYSYFIKARSFTDEYYEVKGFITLLR